LVGRCGVDRQTVVEAGLCELTDRISSKGEKVLRVTEKRERLLFVL
jgi:hypothetical protein